MDRHRLRIPIRGYEPEPEADTQEQTPVTNPYKGLWAYLADGELVGVPVTNPYKGLWDLSNAFIRRFSNSYESL